MRLNTHLFIGQFCYLKVWAHISFVHLMANCTFMPIVFLCLFKCACVYVCVSKRQFQLLLWTSKCLLSLLSKWFFIYHMEMFLSQCCCINLFFYFCGNISLTSSFITPLAVWWYTHSLLNYSWHLKKLIQMSGKSLPEYKYYSLNLLGLHVN